MNGGLLLGQHTGSVTLGTGPDGPHTLQGTPITPP